MELQTTKDLQLDGRSIVIFTTGANTDIKYFGESSTGDWVVDKDMCVDNVIIYHKDINTNNNTIYKGTYIDKTPSEDTRWTIKFKDVEVLGQTNSNWNEFVGDESSNPIRYIDKESK